MRLSVRTAFIALVVLGGTGCRTVNVTSKRFFMPAKAELALPPPVAGSESVTFTLPDGARLHGFWVARPQARATLVFFNGAGGLAEEVVAMFVTWSKALNVNVLVYDYRGAGRSEGTGSIDAVKDDAHVVLEDLSHFKADGLAKVILMGSSMGSMAAVSLAAQKREGFAAIVLDSAPTNVAGWVANQVPWFAKPFLTVNISEDMAALDAERDLAQLQTPLLLTVGDADHITPLAFSQKLLAASNSPIKELHVFHGAEHGESSDHAEYVTVLAGFLDRALAVP